MRVLFATIPFFAALTAAVLLQGSGRAEACAGLIGSNGAVNLGRTTTLAAYHDGVEHYVTAFQFQGGGGEFGTLIPLPGVPTNVERGGGWTLQRLERETQPQFEAAAGGAGGAASAGRGASVILETRIDALDITVLEGGGPDVAVWAEEHGFRLSPDAPEVLDFYAARSPTFLADGLRRRRGGRPRPAGWRWDAGAHHDPDREPVGAAAHPRSRQAGGGPHRCGCLSPDRQQAGAAAQPGAKMALAYSQAASQTLLADLRSDENSAWVPQSAWLTKLAINSATSDLKFDLAVDTSGKNKPSQVAAGLVALPRTGGPITDGDGSAESVVWALEAVVAGAVIAVYVRRRTRASRES